MISIQSRDVLHHLKAISNNTDTELCLLGGSTYICPASEDNNFYDYSKYKKEINSILDELVNAGYLVYPRNNKHFFSLTAKGIHPFQGTFFKILTFLFCSIVVPIVVSILTTLFALNLFGTTEVTPAAPVESALTAGLHLCLLLFQ